MGGDARDGADRPAQGAVLTGRRFTNAARMVAQTLARLWRQPDLATTVAIEVSPRLTVSLGRSLPARGIVRLHPGVAAGPRALLREVLTHEFAHVVAWRRDGGKSGLHGALWASLMEEAGYEPLTCLDRGPLPTHRTRKAAPRRYAHSCPVCHERRVAGRPVRRWRCARCLAAGLPGTLTIRRIA